MILHSVLPSCRVKHFRLQLPCGWDGSLSLFAVLAESVEKKTINNNNQQHVFAIFQ